MKNLSRSSALFAALLAIGSTSLLADTSALIADQSPKVISAVPPVRPRPLMSFGQNGTVEVSFTISAQGEVADVKVKNSTDALLEDSAIAAIKQWKFSPAVKNGQAVAVQARQLISFESTDGTRRNQPEAPATAPKTMVAKAK